MAKTLEKNKALTLREKGRSIGEISELLNIPKSTVGVWCRNLKLGKKQIERLAKRQKSGSYKGRLKYLENVRRNRIFQTEKLKREGLDDIKSINKRDLFVAGIGMYLSEGATSDSNEEVSFTNSDYRTVLFMVRWFNEICEVKNDRFIIQIRINKAHKNRVAKVESYWSKIINVSLSQFSKTVLIKSKSKKIYPKDNVYYGTIRLKIRQGTQLRRKINGWVEGLLKIRESN
ncbi:MAG: hypothetical protein WC711_00105 [Candidatus Staskawiczbacteria bacterium]|jgi:hypothetical protein